MESTDRSDNRARTGHRARAAQALRRVARRAAHLALVTAVTGTVLTGALGTGVAPAGATPPTPPACGAGGTPSVVALADPSFYVDSDEGLAATYAGYTVRASDGQDGLWLKLDGFTGGSVGLAGGQPGSVALPNIAAGSSATAYLLLAASTATEAAQNHTVTLYRGHPDSGTAVCSRSFTYRGVYETIKALANKVESVSTAAPGGTAHIGDRIAVTVTGHTGTLGAGPAADPGVLSYAPNALASFPAGAWRLEKTTMTISPDGVASALTYTDRLYLPAASGPNRPYSAQYFFRAIGPAGATAKVAPVQYIASGTQVKHTDIDGSVDGALPTVSALANVTLAKSASVAVVASSGGTVTYTVTATNSGGSPATLDRVVDTLPSGAVYQTGSSHLAGRALTDPSISGSVLTWPGPIDVPAGGSIALSYQVALPGAAGQKINSVVATYGTSQLDASRDVTTADPATATVTVPEAGGTARPTDDTATTGANTAVTIGVLANDTSTAGFPLSVSAVGPAGHGTATVQSDNTVVYTPDADYAGVDTFAYTLSDGNDTAGADVTVTVTPVARNDIYVTDKSTTLVGATVLANDVCQDCTVGLVTGPSAGALSLNGDGTFTYDAPNQTTTVTFTYQANGPGGVSASAVATIYVNAAGPDQATTAYDTDVTVPVLDNDTCPGNGSCHIATVHAPSHGTATETTGVTYDPDSGFWGIDSFVYDINGGGSATVTVLVAPPPVAKTTTFAHAITGEVDSLAFTGAGTISCAACTYSVATSPAHGTVAIGPATGALTYTPAASYAGPDTFDYAVTDPVTGLTVTGTVTVTVGPEAVEDTAATLVGQNVAIPVLANDACPATCTVTLLEGPVTGTATLNVSDNTITFSTGAAHDIGTVTFSYSVATSAAPGLTETATVTVTVAGALDDAVDTTPGQAVNIPVLGNDPCTDCLLGTVGAPTAGTAAAQPDGSVSYTPPAGFSGTATFTYAVTKNSRSTSATVTVTVLPQAVADSYAVAAGTTADLDPRANDLCVACVIDQLSAYDGAGSVSIAGDGLSVSFTPAPGSGHSEQFTYRVRDVAGHTATAVVTVTVNAPPAAAADQATTGAATPVVVDVLTNDTCSGCSVDVAADAAHGTVAFRADGKAQYLPAAGFSGLDTFRYLVTDPVTGLSAEATVTVTVLPRAVDDQAATAVGAATTVAVLGNDSCTGCDVAVADGPAQGTAAVNPDGTIAYTPTGGYAGPDQFTYRITDPATGETAEAAVSVAVSNATDDATTVAQGGTVDVAVLANDTNCAGCSVTGVGGPDHGVATLVAGGAVRYQPDNGFWGLDTFTYTAGNGTITAQATVRVLVAPPVRYATAGTNGTAAGDLLGAAPCPACEFTVVGGPAGDLALSTHGGWAYTAPADTDLDDTITYRAHDPATGLNVTGALVVTVRPSTITVTVNVVNDDDGALAAASFPVTVNGTAVTSGQSTTFPFGVQYTLAQNVAAGYTQTGIACVDTGTTASVGHPFTLSGGQHVACTVTDDDVTPPAPGPDVDPGPGPGSPVTGYTVSGVIWFDVDHDGARDAGEPVLPGATVTLQPAAGAAAAAVRAPSAVTPSTVTGPDGRYSFSGVAPGSYRVVAHAVAAGLPPSWDSDGATDWQVTLTVAGTDAVADFASTGAGSVAGTVVDRATGAAIPGAAISCTWPGLDGVAGTADDVAFSATSSADGTFLVAGAPFGQLSCTATDATSGENQKFTATVTTVAPARAEVFLGQVAPPAAPARGTLPVTGDDPRRRAYPALALMTTGLILLAATRRRRA